MNGVRRSMIPLLFALPVFPAAAQGFAFAPWVDHLNQDFFLQESIAIGDVTGDGRDDVVVGARTDPFHSLPAPPDQLVLVYVQDAHGELMPAQRHGTGPETETGIHATSVALGDMDGNGLADIVATHNRVLTILLADGCGGFQESTHALPEPAHDVALADIDLDGDLDIFALSALEGATVLRGDGAGGVESAHHRPSAAGGYNAVKVGDVTGDGHDDVVVASVQSLVLFEVHPASTGGFGATIPYPLPENVVAPFGLALGDWNGDGLTDVALGVDHRYAPGKAAPVVARYTQQPGGTLGSPTLLETYNSPQAMAFGDLDGDGLDDLVVLHGGWWKMGYYFGGPAGMSAEFLESTRTLTSWFRPDAIAMGDVNGDGCTDVAYADPGGQGVVGALGIHPGTCGMPSPPIVKPQRAACGAYRATDSFDGDTASDLLWRHGRTGALVSWPSADAEDAKSLGVVDLAWAVAGKGDFDGDGTTDILWRNTATGANVMWRRGSPNERRGLQRVRSQDWRVVAVGDFDGDGRADVFWRNFVTGANAIWLAGDATTQPVVAAVRTQAWQVAGAGDFDHDGRTDLFWRHGGSGANVIWNGGTHREQLPAGPVVSQDWQVAGVGDFDGDGASDLFWRNAQTGANVVWPGASQDDAVAAMGVRNAEWVVAAIGDFDGDRPSDILWRNERTGANVVWMQANYWTQMSIDHVSNTLWKPL